MDPAEPRLKKYLFVCENVRAEGTCCGAGGARVRERLKEAARLRGLSDRLRVCRSGCLDSCAEGPSAFLEPDHVWFRRVGEADVEAILDRAEEGL